MELDLTNEFAGMLSFVSEVAAAIRMNTPYTSEYDSRNPAHAQDNLWLSDCLRSFGCLGEAIGKRSPQQVIQACDVLLNDFERYQEDDRQGFKVGSKAAFERNADRFKLSTAMNILRGIKSKAQHAAKSS